MSGSYSIREHISYLAATFVTVLTSQATMVVDAAIGGNLLGAEAVSAVNLVMPVYELFYALVVLLGMGACTVAAMSLGRGDVDQVRKHFTAAVLSALGVMLIMGCGILVFRERVLDVLCRESVLRDLTGQYLMAMVPYFVIAGMSIILMLFTAMAGRPMLMMRCSIVQFVLNVACNFLLVKGTELGIAALSCSSAISSVAALLMLLPSYLSKDCPFRMIRCTSKELLNAFASNIKYGGSIIAPCVAYGIMAYAMNTLILKFSGEQALFFWSVAIMIYSTADYASVAAQEASLSLGGRLLGAGDKRGFGLVFNRSMLFAMAWIALIVIGVFVFPKAILPFFGATDASTYHSLLKFLTTAVPALVGTSIANLFLVRLVQRERKVMYVVLSSLVFLSIPVFYLFIGPA